MNLWWIDILYKLHFQENFQFKIHYKNFTRFHVAYLDMHSLLHSRLLYFTQDFLYWSSTGLVSISDRSSFKVPVDYIDTFWWCYKTWSGISLEIWRIFEGIYLWMSVRPSGPWTALKLTGTIKYRMVHIQFDGIYSFGLGWFMNSYNFKVPTMQIKREPIRIHEFLTSIMTLKWL